MLNRSSGYLAALVVAAGFAGCRTPRDRGDGDGVHPASFADVLLPGSHAEVLRTTGYPLVECRACHGDDYAGGSVGSSCLKEGCHTEGVESCNTCHDAIPESDAHPEHTSEHDCSLCHEKPHDARGPRHPNGTVEVKLTGLATRGGSAPTWDAGTQTCADVYCHGGRDRQWTERESLDCTGCHEAPPESHVRFADASSDCTTCHGDDVHHIDGALDLDEPGCDGCHGTGPLGAPAPGLFGTTSGGAVGAHARHLDGTLEGRIGPTVPCATCHVIPQRRDDPGHVDESAPADVILPGGGTYAAEGRTCVVACHGGRDPGPSWDDDSGAARACDACHAMPPSFVASGASHPAAGSSPSDCVKCHDFDPATHIDGKVDVRPIGCDGCHGTGPLGAPPPGLDGEMSGGPVGAHTRHLDATLLDRIGRAARCDDCHEVPASIDDPGHLDAARPADVRLWNEGEYDPASRRCVSACHFDRDPGPQWDDESGAARACDACHGFPPAETRIGTPHPPTAPDVAICVTCHALDPATHVDGHVDFVQ